MGSTRYHWRRNYVGPMLRGPSDLPIDLQSFCFLAEISKQPLLLTAFNLVMEVELSLLELLLPLSASTFLSLSEAIVG